MGNVKARGVGEMTFRIGATVSGPATATSRAWVKVRKGAREVGEGVLTLSRDVARADGGHGSDCSFVVCTREKQREKIIVDGSGGKRWIVLSRDKKAS
jgi:hypothetical protein